MKRLVWLVALVGCDGGQAISQPTGSGETIGGGSAGPFFESLGTNGRTCASCHDQTAGWSLAPPALQTLFDATSGLDPVFGANDGTTSPTAAIGSIDERRVAFQLLLDRGLIRVGRPFPTTTEIALQSVDDPYAFASAAELSLFRRPLPATNLRFLATVMWDGREPDLQHQAIDATTGHAEAADLDPATAADIVAFESGLTTAERFDDIAGDLSADGARGGAVALASQAFDPTAAFDRDAFTLYTAWANATQDRQRAIANGEQIFNTHTFQIRGVAGIADQRGTCSTCHDTPNVGSHSTPLFLDLGVGDPDDDDVRGLPVYHLTNPGTGQTASTTDPGYAITTGHWADLGKFKVPGLRGLAMRAPYFHNGRARDLGDVVQFYDRKFDLHLSNGETADLVAFLGAL
ncbi:MAG: cytochrome c peroxidase [Kofleriaceae bacterium]